MKLLKSFFKKRKKPLKTIYLHIGFHKTGTSYLQQLLFKNRELLEKSDITLICPNSYKRGLDKGNAFYVIRRLDRLEKKLDKSKPIALISSEDMSWYTPQKIQALKETLNQYTDDIKIIAYLRNHDDYAVSMKQQGAKAAHIGKIFGHSENVLPEITEPVIKQVSYYPSIKLWSDAFGNDNLTVTTFDYLRQNDVSLLDSFKEAANLAHIELEDIGRANESIDYYWQLFLHKNQSLLWASKAIRNAMLPDILKYGSSSNKKKPSKAESLKFRAFFQSDADKVRALIGDKAVFNLNEPKESEFSFSEEKYESAKSKFIEVFCETTKALYQDKKIDETVLIRALSELDKRDPQTAKSLSSISSSSKVKKWLQNNS